MRMMDSHQHQGTHTISKGGKACLNPKDHYTRRDEGVFRNEGSRIGTSICNDGSSSFFETASAPVLLRTDSVVISSYTRDVLEHQSRSYPWYNPGWIWRLIWAASGIMELQLPKLPIPLQAFLGFSNLIMQSSSDSAFLCPILIHGC